MRIKYFGLANAFAAALAAGPASAIDGPMHSNFTAGEVRLQGVNAEIEIAVGGSNVSVDISGRQERLSGVQVSSGGNVLTIYGGGHGWHWGHDDSDELRIRLTVPRGTNLSFEGDSGEAHVGDIGGRLVINSGSLDANIGSVAAADVHINGSGDVRLGDVAGALNVQIRGSGNVAARSAQAADFSIAGSGDIEMGDVRGGLGVRVAGSGDVKVASVNGPVVSMQMGSGDVSIGRGRAAPLKVTVTGSGDFSFDGEAVDPDISVHGSGDVRIGSYSGTLSSHGNSNLDIGKRVGK